MIAAPSLLRVTHVVQALELGGLERQVIELVRRTDRRVATPKIVCTDSLGGLAALAPGAPLLCIDAHPGFDGRAVLRLARHLRQTRADILHSHNQRAHYLSLVAGRLAGVPVHINTRHGPYLPVTRRGILRRRMLAALSDAVVAVSTDVRDAALRVDHIAPAKVHTIFNGTDITATRLTRQQARQALGVSDDVLVVGAVGRLAAEKDYGTLVAALGQLGTTHPHVMALIIGDGPLLADLTASAQAQGCSRVRFCGYRQDAVSLLPAFDIFVQPSLREGIALAVIEAMAAGLPVVATSVGGNPEALGGGEAGILIPARDVDALKTAVATLADDSTRRRRFGEAGRARVTRLFSIAATTQAYERLYMEQARHKGLAV